jgi:surface antigen
MKKMRNAGFVVLAVAALATVGCTSSGYNNGYNGNGYNGPGYENRDYRGPGPNNDDRSQRWQRRYSRSYSYNDDSYYQQCRNGPDPAGVIAGGLIGGLLGNAAGSNGNRGGTTIAGVIIGGAIGAALTSNLNCEDRSYAYRSYYDGLNSGRPGGQYEWSNPRNNNRGQFRVGDYYDDQDGFRCADFTQTIYVQGRQQQSRGRACRQPDGSWAVVN